MQKQVKFNENLYSDEMNVRIVEDGKLIASRLKARKLDRDFRASDGTYSRSKYDEIAQHATDLEDGIANHSGASFYAVLWSCVQFLEGYDVLVNDTTLVKNDI